MEAKYSKKETTLSNGQKRCYYYKTTHGTKVRVKSEEYHTQRSHHIKTKTNKTTGGLFGFGAPKCDYPPVIDIAVRSYSTDAINEGTKCCTVEQRRATITQDDIEECNRLVNIYKNGCMLARNNPNDPRSVETLTSGKCIVQTTTHGGKKKEKK
jgi:hypothetical protein